VDFRQTNLLKNVFLKTMKKPWFIAILLIILTAFSRIAVADFDYGNLSFDSGSFALAVKDFSIQDGRPHLPGYILYVGFLKILAPYTKSPGVLAAIIFSSLSAPILFFLFKKYLLKTDALLLTLFVIFNPMAWFSGATAEIYSFDLLFSSALVLAGISGRWIYVTPLIMAIGGGFRQSSPVLLFPLYVYLWWQFSKTPDLSFKKFFLYHITGIIIVLMWLIPMVNSTGGFKNYITLFKTHSPLPPTSFFQNIAQFAGFGVFLFAPFVITISVLLFKSFLKNDEESAIENSFKTICFWWVVPPLLFFIFGHYNSSYFLICIGGTAGLLHSFFKNKLQSRVSFSVGIIFSVIIFFAVPYKIPSIETSFAPQNRKISQAEVFKSRVFSAYHLGYQHIKAYSKMVESLEPVLLKKATQEDSPFPDFGPPFFLDPTVPIVARALQPKFPRNVITTLNLHKHDSLIMYVKNEQKFYGNTSEMLGISMIITQKEFFKKYLYNFNFYSVEEKGDLVFATPYFIEERPLIAKLYDSLFVKR
jgi:hypothetical protein